MRLLCHVHGKVTVRGYSTARAGMAEDDSGRGSCSPEDTALNVPSLEATGQSRRKLLQSWISGKELFLLLHQDWC